jgi:hypothetical protein
MLNRLLTILLLCGVALNATMGFLIYTHPHYGPMVEAHWKRTDMDRLWDAICEVESGGRADAVNVSERAVGIAQIRPIMVADVNRILGEDRYQHPDSALSPTESREMFEIYVAHYFPAGDAEAMARGWNGGPKGATKNATRTYWSKVQELL